MSNVLKVVLALLLIYEVRFAQNWITLKNKTTEYIFNGNYGAALDCAMNALKKAETDYGVNDINYSISLSDIALIKQRSGEFSEAEKLFQQALQIRRQGLAENNPYIPVSLHNLANLYNETGQYEKARSYCIKSLEMRQTLHCDKDNDYASALNLLAVIYQNLGDHSKADSLYNQSINIIQDTTIPENNSRYISQLSNIATMQFKEKNYEKAEELFNKAIQAEEETCGKEHPDYAILLSNLASLYKETRQYEKAERNYVQALELRKKLLNDQHPDISLSFGNLASFYAETGRLKEARYYYLEQNKGLIKQIRTYFPVFSENEKVDFWKGKKDEIERFNSFAVFGMNKDSSLIGEMYNLQLASKAVLLDAANKIRERILCSNDENLKKLFKVWHKNKESLLRLHCLSKSDLDSTGIDPDSLEKETELIEKDLTQRSLVFAKEYEKKDINWKEIQELLENNEAAIEIIRARSPNGSHEYKVFYAGLILTNITKEHPDRIVLEDGKTLEEEYYSNYVQSIRSGQDDPYSYDYFWSKFANKLKGIKKVYLSCDGVYNQINLQTLKMANGGYLIDSLDIVIVSNTKDIFEIKSKKKYQNNPDIKNNYIKTACLFGAPDFNLPLRSEGKNCNSDNCNPADSISKGRTGIEYLPGTMEEITSIGNILRAKDWKAKIFSGPAATEGNLRSVKSPGLLHIATHGCFEESPELMNDNIGPKQNPFLKSMLMLAGANYTLGKGLNPAQADNGILTAAEAMNLDLDSTNLVVLSACLTGKGEVVNGEGAYGLQRAFQIAGAKAVIMSLWKVEDNFTRDFMTLFYKYWSDSTDNSEAFKSAVMEIKKKYTAPRYWGAFQLIGK